MQLRFVDDHHTATFQYAKDQIIDSSERPEDQITRWLNRGVVVPVAENPIKNAVETAEPKTKTKK